MIHEEAQEVSRSLLFCKSEFATVLNDAILLLRMWAHDHQPLRAHLEYPWMVAQFEYPWMLVELEELSMTLPGPLGFRPTPRSQADKDRSVKAIQILGAVKVDLLDILRRCLRSCQADGVAMLLMRTSKVTTYPLPWLLQSETFAYRSND